MSSYKVLKGLTLLCQLVASRKSRVARARECLLVRCVVFVLRRFTCYVSNALRITERSLRDQSLYILNESLIQLLVKVATYLRHKDIFLKILIAYFKIRNKKCRIISKLLNVRLKSRFEYGVIKIFK